MVDHLKIAGPKYGYHPKINKTVLIVKNPEDLEKAHRLFNDGVKITTEGERHIGAVIGTANFTQPLVNKWVKDVEQLSKVAEEEPQSALYAFNSGLSRRWAFLQRTVTEIDQLFVPLENAIRHHLIPAIVGRQVNDTERDILALPFRFGGLGIQNPIKTAQIEYNTSKQDTSKLADLIVMQDSDVSKVNVDLVKETKRRLKTEKEAALKQKATNLMETLPDNEARSFLTAQEKGASSWLSSPPIKALGYSLNKQEFRDAIYLRYGWKMKNTPTFCVCGKENTTNHTLICPKGGYVSLRHNSLRNTEAKIMREVCKDVVVEPALLPARNDQHTSTNKSEKAQLDISARGVFGLNERTFFDIRVTHANADTYKDKTLSEVYKLHESMKKNAYNDRVLQVEKGSFVPLVFTTSGGFGPECEKFNKRLAMLIATKRKEKYADVVKHIRTRLRFALLRSSIVAVRGERGQRKQCEKDFEGIDFNMIPEEACYES